MIKNKQIRIRQIIDYESYDFEDFATMNVNTNLSTTKKSVSFETRNKNENLFQTKTNQSQTTKNFQHNDCFQNTAAQNTVQLLSAIQKQIRSLFDDNRNFIIDQLTFRTNDVKNISVYDFVNILSKQNIFQKQSNFVNMTNRNLNVDDRLFFDRIDRSQVFKNDRKKIFFFQSYQRRSMQNHSSTKQKQSSHENQFFRKQTIYYFNNENRRHLENVIKKKNSKRVHFTTKFKQREFQQKKLLFYEKY